MSIQARIRELIHIRNEEAPRFGEWTPAISFGKVRLHSGGDSDWLFDALMLHEDFHQLVVRLAPQYPVIGIEFAGALLAQSYVGGLAGIVRKNGGDVYLPSERLSHSQAGRVSLIDDVCTTESSFLEAAEGLGAAGVGVHEYLCIMDRRSLNNRRLEVRSLVTAEELGLS